MKKHLKNAVELVFAVGLAFSLFIGVASQNTKNKAYAEDYSIALTSGKHAKWIDRIDLSADSYARDFYDWLVENTDNDGVDDVLIDFNQNEHVLRVVEGTFTVDASQPNFETIIGNELTQIASVNLNRVSDYCSLVYSAFNRDHNEVFWLQRGIYTLSSISCTYTSNGNVNYTQTLSLLIKNNDPTDDVTDFDMRLDAYANGTLDIKTEIVAVNNAIDSILAGVESEATAYEKVRYFNKWLTENNCYAEVIGSNSRDARGALLGQDGNSDYAPVCEGYARAFKVLCDRAKIPCVLSSGNAGGEAHMWNLVQMEDGKWYAVDVTWNDPTVTGVTSKLSGAENEEYLIVSKHEIIDGEKFSLSHEEINQTQSDSIALNNGPTLSLTPYGAPVQEMEWDVSAQSGVDFVTAILYRADGYTDVNPVYKLIVSGTGNVKEYLSVDLCPWKDFADKIVEIEIRAGVNSILGVAFNGFDALEEVKVYSNLNFDNGVFDNTDGSFICHYNYACYQKAQSLGFNVGEICNIENWNIQTSQGCEQDEILIGECVECGHEQTKVGELAYGHDYAEWVLTTVPTKTRGGVLSRTCSNNQSHVETFDIPSLNNVDYTYSVVEPPKCEVEGKEKFVYNKDGQVIAIECDIEPIGHDFAEPTYTWDYLKKTCEATRICNNDHAHVETEVATATTDREVDCSTSGYVTFSVSFANGAFESQSKSEYMTAKPHDYSDQYKYDEQSHWYECKDCLSKKDEANHVFGEWKTEKEPSLFSSGLKTHECACGYSEEEELPKVQFFKALFSGNISGDMKFILICGGSLVGIILLAIILKAVFKKKY